MRQKLLTLSITFLFTIFYSLSFSQQLKEFSSDPEEYLKDMEDLFSRSETNGKKGKELLKEFEELWLETGFTPEERERVVEISNLMLKKRARNFPHFYDYINTLKTACDKNMSQENYIEWEKGLKYLLTDKKSKLDLINSYIYFASDLLKYNAIYYSRTVKWYADNSNYKIVFENDTAKLIYDALTLKCNMRSDSMEIFNTSGTYYPFEARWNGNRATVTWERVGFDKNTTWAELGDYNLDLTKSTYSIPEVKLYHKIYFDYPIVGTITDKVVETNSKTLSSYPRFESKEKQFVIKNFEPDVDYKGGFSMKGSRFFGNGTSENKASLDLWRDVQYVNDIGDTLIRKEIFMQTRAITYGLNEKSIISNDAEISIYIDKDSIYHPGLLFKFHSKNREINLIREEDADNKSKSPYYNSYHKIEMDFEYLTWVMGDKEVNMTMLKGTAINVARFESNDYFSAERYYEEQGLEDVHPFVSLSRYARKTGVGFVHAHDFAKFTRLPIAPIHNLFIELSYKGILEYNTETQIAFIKPKMYKYLRSRVGLTDYDLINFESRTESSLSNAILNLVNMDLEIQGVPMINLSDSQNVIFYPKNQELLFKKNRDFDFSGRIEAGLFTFYGDNFQFKYDSFLVDLNKIDSLSIKVQAGSDGWGRRVLSNVQNVIEDVTGNLQIDDPNNKSGVKHFPQYPIFESKKNSYVYYDAPYIQMGKYPRDSFYFTVYPYIIDSLNTFTSQGMGYDGELLSANIFPVIEERLVLQTDNSLGFSYDTPEKGLPVFGDKGNYYKKINLSNQGLRGDGDLKYLTSKSNSNDFIFYPDSMNGFTNSYEIMPSQTGTQYPDVKAGNIYMHWMPYFDNMTTKDTGEPFVMYGGKSKHYGKLDYSPQNLTGVGRMNYYNSNLTSQYITYNYDNAVASTASFEIEAEGVDSLVLNTDNVSALVDFKEMKSTFTALNGISKVELPQNLYDVYMEQFSWLMLEKSIQFETPNTALSAEMVNMGLATTNEAEETPTGSLFVSTHGAQESLNWISPIADFNLKTNQIAAHKVKYINVADAQVYPNNGEVEVGLTAKMHSLLDAKVLASRETQYHNFHDATINIYSRKKYSGEGLYNYIDENGSKQPISFYLIAVDSIGDGNTFARGKITGIEDFSLSPAFKYQGNVALYAEKEFLTYDGATKISHNCHDAIDESWVKFSEEINPNDIYIPISDKPQDINDMYLVSGPMIATDSVHLFPSFLTPWKEYSNRAVCAASGYLQYEKAVKTYKIASKEKLQNKDTTGNILMLHKDYCNIYGEGKIDLTADLGRIEIRTAGNTSYKLGEDEIKAEVLMTLDFYLPKACFDYIADTINAKGNSLNKINFRSVTLDRAMKELIDNYSADQFIKENAIFGTVKELPSELMTSFVFTDLKLKWNHKLRAWQSIGPLNVADIKGKQINKVINGNLEIIRKRSGDIFTLYIEISPEHWYFFYYRRGMMQTYSSEKNYNKIITDTKGSDRKLKAEQGKAPYIFSLSNKSQLKKFIEHIEQDKEMEEDQDDDKKRRKDEEEIEESEAADDVIEMPAEGDEKTESVEEDKGSENPNKE